MSTRNDLRRRPVDGAPVAERRLRPAGIPTAILEGGDGPPIVLLHGPGGSAEHWLRVLPDLARDHRVVAPDLPGHGRSGAADDLEADRALAWLGELIERTCASPPALVGHALGGAIAARLAAGGSPPLASLVLVDALGLAPFAPAPEFGAALAAFMAEPSAATHDELWSRCAHDLDALRSAMAGEWPAFREENLARARTPGMIPSTGRLMELFGTRAIPPEELDAIDVPTSLVWGRHDLATPVAVAEGAAARHGWTLHVIEDSGADPPIEHPAEFVRALRAAVAGPDDAAALRHRLRGTLLRPRDAGFAEATRIWNGMIRRTPALVVRPATTADVQAAVTFARRRGMAVSVRGGGHNIAGTALADGGLTLDMSGRRRVRVDPDARTAVVDAGCLLSDVDRETQRHGLATPLGFYSEVGVAGLTLGGGLGYLTRRFGWTVDNLLEVEIVTADGVRRRAGRDEDPDLFWAIRGAGANLGVVTSFTFRLHEVGPTVYGGLIAWPFERAAEILRAYRALTVRAPRELAAWMIILRAPPAPFVPEAWHGRRICAMSVCYSGDLDRADDAVAPIRALGDPVADLLCERPYTEIQSYLDGTEPKGDHYYWKTEYAAELGDELLETWHVLAADCPVPMAQLGVLHLGGALNERDVDDGAVGNRDARYALGAIGAWEPHEPRADAFRRWIREAWEGFRPFSTGGSYINFQTADEDADRIRASYGANFDRLVAVKERVDPENIFRSNRNVRRRLVAEQVGTVAALRG